MGNNGTFECAWCKEAGCDLDEYTFPLDELGGHDKKTGQYICQPCRDEASDGANFEY